MDPVRAQAAMQIIRDGFMHQVAAWVKKGKKCYNRDHAASAASRATQKAIDDEVDRITAGIVVTPETFAVWRAGYEADMEKQPLPTTRVALKHGKFTGKELFHRDAKLISSDEALSGADADALASIAVDVGALDGLDLGELDAELDGLDEEEGGAAD